MPGEQEEIKINLLGAIIIHRDVKVFSLRSSYKLGFLSFDILQMEKRKANYDPMLTLLPKPNHPVINIIPEICMYYYTKLLETQDSFVREDAISHRFHPVVCATLMIIKPRPYSTN